MARCKAKTKRNIQCLREAKKYGFCTQHQSIKKPKLKGRERDERLARIITVGTGLIVILEKWVEIFGDLGVVRIYGVKEAVEEARKIQKNGRHQESLSLAGEVLGLIMKKGWIPLPLEAELHEINIIYTSLLSEIENN